MTPNQIDVAVAEFTDRTGVKAKRVHLSRLQAWSLAKTLIRDATPPPFEGAYMVFGSIGIVISDHDGPHVVG